MASPHQRQSVPGSATDLDTDGVTDRRVGEPGNTKGRDATLLGVGEHVAAETPSHDADARHEARASHTAEAVVDAGGDVVGADSDGMEIEGPNPA